MKKTLVMAYLGCIGNTSLAVLIALGFARPANATTGPGQLTYEGRALDALGNPLIGNTSVKIRVHSPGGCLLYEEHFLRDLTGTDGFFSVKLGTGANQVTGGSDLRTVLRNGSSTPIPGSGCNFLATTDGTGRVMRLLINNELLSGDLEIGTVPHAMSADTLRGFAPSDFVTNTGSVTQSAVEALTAGTSGLYVKASTNGAAALPAYSSGTSPASPSAGQIWYDVSSGSIKYYNGSVQSLAGSGPLTASDIPNLPWSKITSGVPSTLSGFGITDSVRNSSNVPALGSGLLSALPISPALGELFVATDSKEIHRYNGSSWNIVSSLSAGHLSGTLNTAQLPVVPVGKGGTGLGAVGTANQFLVVNASVDGLEYKTLAAGTNISFSHSPGTITISSSGGGGGGSGSGTVTSVGLALPSIFDVTTATVTDMGTLTAALTAQPSNSVFAGPVSGPNFAPNFRPLVSDDLPALDASKISTGVLEVARGGTGGSSFAANQLVVGNNTSAFSTIASGSAGQMLRSGGSSAPTWSTATWPSAVTFQALLFGSSADVVGEILPPIVPSVLVTAAATNAPMWSTGNSGTVLKGGSDGITFGQVDLESEVSGTLPLTRGGTGRSSFSANAIMATDATGAPAEGITCATNGNVMTWTAAGGWTCAAVPAATMSQLADGTATAPSLSFVNQTNAGFFRPVTNSIGVSVAESEKWRFDIASLAGQGGDGRPRLLSDTPSAGSPAYNFTGNMNSGMYSPGIDQVAFSTDGTERIRIGSTGRVGIGTTAPNGQLEISSTAPADGSAPTTLRITGAQNSSAFIANSAIANLDFFNNDASFEGPGVRTRLSTVTENVAGSNWALTFSTAAFNATPTEKLRITSAGNMGIGTSHPTSILGLSGAAARAIGVERNPEGVAGVSLTVRSGGAALGFTDLNGGDLILASGISTGTGGSAIRFRTATGAAAGAADNLPTTKVIITDAGNVGIGTTAPGARLHVHGAIVSAPHRSSGLSLDLAQSNTHILNSLTGSALTLTGLVDGGSYTVVITDATSRTYTFSGCENAYFKPANGPTSARTVYGILSVWNGASFDCYINWTTGYL